jgi:Transcriptional activator of glycolytic enzymes
MPRLIDYLQGLEARQAQQQAQLQAQLQAQQQQAQLQAEQQAAEMKALVNSIAELQAIRTTELKLLKSSNHTFRLDLAAAIATAATAATTATTTTTATATTTRVSPVASPVPLSSNSEQQEQQEQQQQQQQQEPYVAPLPPTYRMSRAVKTIDRLWHEWIIGFAGSPSIQALDSKWGSRWRAGRHSELQWYSLRLEAIKEIRRIAQAQRIGEEAAMRQLNLQQQQMGCSLDQLCKRLRVGRKAR